MLTGCVDEFKQCGLHHTSRFGLFLFSAVIMPRISWHSKQTSCFKFKFSTYIFCSLWTRVWRCWISSTFVKAISTCALCSKNKNNMNNRQPLQTSPKQTISQGIDVQMHIFTLQPAQEERHKSSQQTLPTQTSTLSHSQAHPPPKPHSTQSPSTHPA